MLPVYRGLQICIVKYSTPNSLVREKFVIFFYIFRFYHDWKKFFFKHQIPTFRKPAVLGLFLVSSDCKENIYLIILEGSLKTSNGKKINFV